MIIGFTGTRKGMSSHQAEKFSALIDELKPKEFHHGMCTGADENAHTIIMMKSRGKTIEETKDLPEIIGHPPTNQTYMTSIRLFGYNHIHKPQDYLARNKEIVDSSDILIAVPDSVTEELRSGTWSTVRYARKKRMKIYILTPYGQTKIEN